MEHVAHVPPRMVESPRPLGFGKGVLVRDPDRHVMEVVSR